MDFSKMTKEELVQYIELTANNNAEVRLTEKELVHIKHPKLQGVSQKGTLYKQGINLSKTACKELFGNEAVFKEIKTKVMALDLEEDQMALAKAQKERYELELKAKEAEKASEAKNA